MIDLLLAELLKLRTTRMVYGLLGALLLIVLIVNVAAIATGQKSDFDEENQAGLFGAAASGIIFVLLLGVMLMAGEFRHGTITQTFLITPSRVKVLAAKIVAGGVLGLAFGVIAELFSFVISFPLLELKGVDFVFGDQAWDLVLGTVLATTMCGLLGVALGTVIRNQVVAIVVVFVTLLIVEQILTASIDSRWPGVPKYFPGHAITSVVDPGDSALLSREGGLLVLAGYILVLAGLGARFMLPRDVNSIQA